MHLSAPDHRLDRAQALIDQRFERELDRPQIHASGLDLGQIEHVVDQPEQMVGAGQDLLEIAVLPLRQHVLAAAHDQPGEADDRVHRRPQLMAHVGQELGLGGARLLGLLLGRLQRLLGALEMGQVVVGQHPAAVGQRHALILEHPAGRQAPLRLGHDRLAELVDPLGDVVVPTLVGDVVDAPMAVVLEDLAEGRPLGHQLFRHVPHLPVSAVVNAHAQIGLEHQHAVVDGLEQRVQLAQVLLLDLDRGVAEHGERVGHAADLVAPGGRQRRAQIAAGDRQHAVAQRTQARDQVAIDVAPYDQARAEQAQQHHADQHGRAEPLRAKRFPVGGVDVLVDGADQPIERVADLARQADILRKQPLRLADDASAPRRAPR